MPWITLADSDIGDREEQQDRFLVEHSADRKSHLLVVADGAGGHMKGALAAQTAIDCIRENLATLWSSGDPESYLHKLIILCNERVLAIDEADMACTTLVLVLVKGDEIYWGHVGDSRFYLIREGKVVLRTTDHSMVELQRQSTSHVPEIQGYASANGLYMCLGALSDITPEVASSVVRAGDTLLLCSDGLWNQLDMQPLIVELSEQPLTLDSLNKWTEQARISKTDNSDNITLLAAKLIAAPTRLVDSLKAVQRLFKK